MENRAVRYKIIFSAITRWGLLAIILALQPAATTVAGEPDAGTMSGPIHITADRLVTDMENHSAQFSGSVHAIQGDTQIKADRLTVYYRSNDDSAPKTGNTTIERITAQGHVRITFDNRLAVSEQAVYITSERKLVLKGPGSKVTSGQDEIVGSKITYHRDDGRVTIEGDDQNRVKAVFHADQKDLN